jgi:hypothetical protein
VNTKSSHIPTSFRGEVNKASRAERHLEVEGTCMMTISYVSVRDDYLIGSINRRWATPRFAVLIRPCLNLLHST